MYGVRSICIYVLSCHKFFILDDEFELKAMALDPKIDSSNNSFFINS